MFENLKPDPSLPDPLTGPLPPSPAGGLPQPSLSAPDASDCPAEPVSPPPDPALECSQDDPLDESAEDEPEGDDLEREDAAPEWKQALREDFEDWLESLEELPEPEDSAELEEETPDLYSFYEQLAAANIENRKSNRRTAEAISQWGETVARFDGSLAPLREAVAQLAAVQPRSGELARPHCLALVELLDRLQRVALAFASPPAKSSWWRSPDAAWRQAWETQRQAFEITLSHLQGLLAKAGVTRIEALGQPFDPSVMTAVAVETNPDRPNQTVLEELAAGYRRHGELLRPAQVKVNRQSNSSLS